jgi:hypothetical protein
MTPEAAQTEVHILADEMAEMLASGVLDEARLRQIEVRTARLCRMGAGQDPTCDMIMFMVAFGLGDLAKAEKWIESAVRNPILLNKIVLLNAANIWSNIGNLRGLVELLDLAVQRYPNDRKTCMVTTTLYDRAGLIFSAAKAFDKFADLVAPEHKMDSPQYQQFVKECQLATEIGFSEAEIAARLCTAVAAVKHSGFEILRTTRQKLSDGSFVQQFYVAADSSQCAGLTFDIADALCEEYEKPGAELFSVVCRPMAHYALHNEVIAA